MSRCKNKIIRYTLILTLVCFAIVGSAQTWNIYVGSGIATYSLNECRDYQKYMEDESLIHSKAIQSFPAFFTYSIGVSKQWTHWILGLDAGHGSTGGRVFYEDYSGKVIYDQLIRYNYLGVTPGIIFYSNEKYLVSGGCKVSWIHYRLEIRNALTIGNQTLHENADFESFNFGFQPYLNIKRYVGKRIFIQSSLGYEIQSNSEANMDSHSSIFLADRNGNPVHIQGNGLRLIVAAGIRF